jgi:hypothetical protein
MPLERSQDAVGRDTVQDLVTGRCQGGRTARIAGERGAIALVPPRAPTPASGGHSGYMAGTCRSRVSHAPRAAFRPVWQVKSEGERPALTLFLYIINKYFLDYLISKNKSVKTPSSPSLFTPLTPALFTPVPPPNATQGLFLPA